MSPNPRPVRDRFLDLADWLTRRAHAGELVTAYLRGEDSDFVRITGARVRQAGRVTERELTVTLTAGARQASATLDLGGVLDEDRARVGETLTHLRASLPHLLDDPLLNLPGVVEDTEQPDPGETVDSHAALRALLGAAGGLDLVGLWAAGPVYAGFASSTGQRNWFQRSSFHLDFSCHLGTGRAVKARHAGTHWDAEAVAAQMEQVRADLARLEPTPRELAPGPYRAYLGPAALRELLAVLAWGGFSLKAWRTRQTPLLRLVDGDRRLHPMLTLREDNRASLAPRFSREGFVVPPAVTLVDHGTAGESLAAARSAREYGLAVNAVQETPRALALEPGDLAADGALSALGTGLYLSNLWYCNLSDRNDCRITGMTRYASFWVEDGRVVAPLAPMRFDESLYHTLGDRLLALTRERELIPDESTYEGRSTATMCLPGALCEDFRLTL